MANDSQNEDETPAKPWTSVAYCGLRIAFLLIGTLVVLGGVALICAFVQQGGWWVLMGGVLLSLGGCWFAWVAIFGSRKLIDGFFAELLAGVLERLF